MTEHRILERVELMDFIVLNLGYAQTVHAWGNRDISSPFVRFYYVKQGKALLHLPDRDIEATEGHIYLLPSYLPHSYQCEPGFGFYYLFVFQRRSDKINLFDTYDFPIEVRTNEAMRLLFENYCTLYPQLNLPTLTAEEFDNHPAYYEYAQAFMHMQDYERVQLHGMVEIVFSYFLKHALARNLTLDPRIGKVLEYVNQHISQTITVEQLADKACVSPSYLIRAFRQEVGQTPLQYVIQRKIQRAQNLLLGTDMSIHRIAALVGFQDGSYFIRLFKSHIGYTPQEYRQKLIG